MKRDPHDVPDPLLRSMPRPTLRDGAGRRRAESERELFERLAGEARDRRRRERRRRLLGRVLGRRSS